MCAQTLPPPPPAAQGCRPQRAPARGGVPQGLVITVSVGPSVPSAGSPAPFTGLFAADPPAPLPAASRSTSALPDTRHGAGASLGSGATAAVAPCEAAARTAEPRAPAERAARPRPASGTQDPTVSQSTPPPPPPAHSTAGGKVAPGAGPVRGQPHRDPPPPGAPLSAYALTWGLVHNLR